MVYLKNFTLSMEKAPEINPTMERWLYGTKELDRKLSERIISLCRYFDRIPKQSLIDYVDVLLEALNREDIKKQFLYSVRFGQTIPDFIRFLENTGEQDMIEKAELLRENLEREI